MKLNQKRVLLVGLAFMSISGFWQLYDFIIPLILKTEFHIQDTVSGVVMALDNVLALFLLPLFGKLSDRFESPYGRRMPFIIMGTVIAVGMLLVLPYATEQGRFVLFAISLFVLLLAMSFYRSPAVALMPDITLKPLRSEANALINLMGAVGGVIVLLIISLLSPEKMGSYYPVFTATAILMGASVLLMVLFVKENKWAEEMRKEAYELGIETEHDEDHEKIRMPKAVRRSMLFLLFSIAFWFMGYNAVISAFSRYATIELDFTTANASLVLLIANGAAIVSFIPIGKLSNRWGRKKTILRGVVLLAVAFGTAFSYQSYSPWMIVNFVLAGMAWAAINVNSLPMVLEMASEAEIGEYTGLYYTFSMAAQIITPILSGVLFDLFSYRILFPYAVFFILCAFLTMRQVEHGDSLL